MAQRATERSTSVHDPPRQQHDAAVVLYRRRQLHRFDGRAIRWMISYSRRSSVAADGGSSMAAVASLGDSAEKNPRDVQKRLAQLYDWLLAPLETRIGEKIAPDHLAAQQPVPYTVCRSVRWVPRAVRCRALTIKLRRARLFGNIVAGCCRRRLKRNDLCCSVILVNRSNLIICRLSMPKLTRCSRCCRTPTRCAMRTPTGRAVATDGAATTDSSGRAHLLRCGASARFGHAVGRWALVAPLICICALPIAGRDRRSAVVIRRGCSHWAAMLGLTSAFLTLALPDW